QGVGNKPLAIFAADVDRDLSLDLITANSMDDNVSVLTNGCCVGMRGNADNDPADLCTILDAEYIIAYLLTGGPAPYCMEEADVDGDNQVTLLDADYIVQYLYHSGPAPVDCGD
ncbi:MAG: hypothetical protein JSW34_11240, partial [Candidatus Zixiibacteriota bacterium]